MNIFTGDDKVIEGEPEPGKIYTEQDFNRNIVIKAVNKSTLLSYLKLLIHLKSLLFLPTQAHAALIRDLINQESVDRPTDYCVRVTAMMEI